MYGMSFFMPIFSINNKKFHMTSLEKSVVCKKDTFVQPSQAILYSTYNCEAHKSFPFYFK